MGLASIKELYGDLDYNTAYKIVNDLRFKIKILDVAKQGDLELISDEKESLTNRISTLNHYIDYLTNEHLLVKVREFKEKALKDEDEFADVLGDVESRVVQEIKVLEDKLRSEYLCLAVELDTIAKLGQ